MTPAPVAAALLNLTGLGAGYAYLHRYLRWALYLAGMLGLAVAAYRIEDDTLSLLWAAAAGAWIALSVWDGWHTAHRRLGPASEARGRTAPILVALLLIVVEATTFWLYRSAGERVLAAAWDAHRGGDCRTAVERYGRVGTLQKLTFSSVVASAQARSVECLEFLAAQAARKAGPFPTTVTAYRSFLRDHPNSVLVPLARDELAGTQREWKRSYQRKLTWAGRRITASVARLRRLGAVPRLSVWFQDAGSQFAKVRKAIEEVAPPARAAVAHGKLEAALDAFAAELGGAGTAVRDRILCAAPALLAAFARDDTGRDLRIAEASLRRKGFRIDLSALTSERQTNHRLPNGRFLVSGDRSGSNSVNIENEGRSDAVFAFTLGSKRPVMSLYSRSGEDYTISGVPDGEYRVYYTTGEDWNGRHRTFTRFCQFLTMGERFNLQSDASSYTIGTLTISPRRKGKGHRLIPVKPGDFPGGPG